MVWSYYGPFNELGQVRFLIGDTDTNDQLLQDEEIYWLLTEHSTVKVAAAEAAEIVARKFARLADESYQGYSVRYRDRADFYWQLAKDLRRRMIVAMPFAGGISVADKTFREQEADRVKPAFRVGQWDDDGRSREDAQGTP